jgi:hypothetical protein
MIKCTFTLRTLHRRMLECVKERGEHVFSNEKKNRVCIALAKSTSATPYVVDGILAHSEGREPLALLLISIL